MDFNAFKELAVRAAEAAGLADFELYYEGSEETSLGVFQHEIDEFSSQKGGGVSFRCVVDGKMGYASTEELSEEQAASVVQRAMANARSLETTDPVLLCPGGLTYQTFEEETYDLPSTEAMIAAALAAQDKLYAADERVVDGCGTNCFARHTTVAIVNSRGLDLRRDVNLSGMFSMAVVEENGEKANEYEAAVGELTTLDTDTLVRKAVDGALESLGGEPAPTTVCPVVFTPKAFRSLLMAFSGIFSSENAQRGLSKLHDREGETIAAPIVTLVDDPFRKGSPFPTAFDFEGSPTYKKNIIENGVLKTLLYNMKTAAKAGRQTTGNASRRSYSTPVGIQPFSLYLEAGDLSEEELLQKAGNGVLINSLQGLHAGASAVSGDFSLQSAGFLIRDGKKAEHVKSFTVAGNFFELLEKITALSNEVEFPPAMGTVSIGSPYVLVEDLSIAGK